MVWRETSTLPIMIGVPSVRKWWASSLPLEPKSEPWLKGTKLYYWTKPGRRHAVDHTSRQHTWQTGFLMWHQAGGSEPPEPQSIRSTDRNPQRTLACLQHPPKPRGSNPKSCYSNHWASCLRDYRTPTPPVGFPCVWALVSLHSPAARTRSR